MSDGASAEVAERPEPPLTTIELRVHEQTVVAQTQVGDAERSTTWGKLGDTPRRRVSIELLSALLREAMDLESSENSLRDDLYRKLLEVLGQELFDLLLQGGVRDRVREHLRRVRLRETRLRLMLSFDHGKDGKWLAALPWEYIHTPAEEEVLGWGGFLSTEAELMLSRRLEVESRALGEDPTPLKVLLVCASPTAPGADGIGLTRVDPTTMLATLNRLGEDNFIVLETLIDENPPRSDQAPEEGYTWKATRETFAAKVAEFDPVLIHFMGHGRCSHGHGELAFSFSNGRTDWMTGEDFATFACESSTLKAVFLQACESALPDPYVGFSGIAQELANQGLPAVVAMQYRIAAPTADLFASAFYEALKADAAVDEAVKAGRDALRTRSDPRQRLSFGLPVLYLSAYKAISRRRGTARPIAMRPGRAQQRRDWHGRCDVCATAFAVGASFCSGCGRPLPPYCRTCGTFAPAEPANFCATCGAVLGEAPPRADVAIDAAGDDAVGAEIAQAFEGPGALR